jgi:hypothetical protein
MKLAHSDAPGVIAAVSSPLLWRPQIAIERVPRTNSEFTLLHSKESLFKNNSGYLIIQFFSVISFEKMSS